MYERIILRVSDHYEAIIDEDTGKTIIKGKKLDVEDVLFALGYRFEIEEVDD